MINPKNILAHIMAGASLIAGFMLLFISLFLPPQGEIHSSVIYSFGEILLFVGSLMGISIHYHNNR